MHKKLFCIGFNKTGTTSLEKVLSDLGLRLPPLGLQVRDLVPAIFQGDFKAVTKFVSQYDAFQDNPFSQGVTYSQVDVLFPGSKFILTVREAESWYQSYCRYALKLYGVSSLDQITAHRLRGRAYDHINHALFHIQRRNAIDLIDTGVEENWSALYRKDRLLRLYEERNSAIARYFADRPDDLLVIDVSKERDTSKIVDFLGASRSHVKVFPHLNRSQ
jgi:hypothetical protein